MIPKTITWSWLAPRLPALHARYLETKCGVYRGMITDVKRERNTLTEEHLSTIREALTVFEDSHKITWEKIEEPIPVLSLRWLEAHLGWYRGRLNDIKRKKNARTTEDLRAIRKALSVFEKETIRVNLDPKYPHAPAR